MEPINLQEHNMTIIHEFTGVEAVEIRTDVTNMWHAGQLGDDAFSTWIYLGLQRMTKLPEGWLEWTKHKVEVLVCRCREGDRP